MLKGGGIVLALAGWLILAAAPKPPEQNKAEQPKASQNVAQSAPAPNPSTALRPTGQGPVLEPPCGQGEQDRQRDLCAQWEAADAAGRAALWAMIGTIVAAIGTVGLYWQISLTRQAVEDTGEASEAMAAQNALMAEEQRAWISIEAEITAIKIKERYIEIDYAVTYKNIGKTVATGVITHFGHDFLGDNPGNGVRMRFKNWAKSKRPQQGTALIPGEEITLPGSHTQSHGSIAWFSDEPRVSSVVAASVSYRSGSDAQPHKTERSFLFGWRGEDSFDHRYFYKNQLGGDVKDLVRSPFVTGEST